MKSVFTCGDINGIGPEIVVKSVKYLENKKKSKIFIVVPAVVFLSTLKTEKIDLNFEIVNRFESASRSNSVITVIDIGSFSQNIGYPTKESGSAAYTALKIAFKLLKSKQADTIITAPISKEAVNSAGYKISGHTELLAKWCNIKEVVMMFVSSRMKAALLTIHIPLHKVSKSITVDLVKTKTAIMINSLKRDFGIKNPKIAFLGLNPHAGENGLIGKEEKKVILPIIRSNSAFYGPFPSDAFFAHRDYEKFELIIGNYHDQLLIPFKMLNASHGVNYTAGLPIVRTSPDHGTAFDIAGKGIANHESMLQAFLTARKIYFNRKRFDESL